MKKGYMIYPHWWETIQKLENNEKAQLLDAIFKYINEGEIIELDRFTDIAFTPILEQFKIDNEKYERVCKQRQEAGKMGGLAKAKQKLAKASKGKQNIPKSRDKENDNVKDNEKVNEKEIILSKDSKAELVDKRNVGINEMQQTIKNTVEGLGLMYKPGAQERNRIQNILTANTFGETCSKANMGREQFVIEIIKLSNKLKFWNGKVYNAETVYKHYAQVYNQAVNLKQEKQSKKPLVI